jgi:hypothetical protein
MIVAIVVASVLSIPTGFTSLSAGYTWDAVGTRSAARPTP